MQVPALAIVVGTIALLAPPALAKPVSTDQVMVWRLFQPAGTSPPNDVTIYVTKQFWLDDTWGVYAFYTPVGSAVLRGTGRIKLDDVTVTGMLGARWTGITGSLATFTDKFHEGPELALNVAYPICPCSGLTLSGMASYAYLNESNKTAGEAKSLIFYGFALSSPPIADTGTTLSAGLLGSVMVGTATGQKFHDIGPTLTVSHSY